MSEARDTGGRRPRIPRAKGPAGRVARPATGGSAVQAGFAGSGKQVGTGRKPVETTRVAVGGSARVTANGRGEGSRRPRKTRQTQHPGSLRLGDLTETPETGSTQPPGGFPSLLVAVIGVVLIAVVAVGQPLSQMWKQNREYNAISQSLAEAKAEKQRLTTDLEKWRSDAFIASQARSRLGYIRPGETQYLVVDLPTDQDAATAGKHAGGPPRPWYLLLSDSVKLAETKPATDPATNPVTDGNKAN